MGLALRAVVVVSVLCATGCGRGAVFLTIEAVGPEGALVIPRDVDRLSLRVASSAAGESLLEKDYLLTDQEFPLSIGLDPGPRAGPQIYISVNAWKGDVMISTTSTLAQIDKPEVTSITVRLNKL